MVEKIDDVISLKTYLSSYYALARMRMKECDDYWNVSYQIKVPKFADVYKPYKALRKCQAAVDHVMSIGRRVYVPAWGDGEKVLAISEKLQKWGNATLDHLDSQPVNTTRVNALHSFLYGMWVRRTPIFLKDKWPLRPSTLGMSKEEKRRTLAEYERKKAFSFPFRAVPVNPQNFMPDPNIVDPQYVMETEVVRAGDVRRLFPNWKSSKGDKQMVEYVQYWSPKAVCILAAGEPVTDGVEENVMGFIPYEWGYSGFGNESPTASPEDRIVGLVWPAISSLRAEARLKSAAVIMVEQNTYGRPVVSTTPGPDLAFAQEIGELSVVPDYYNYRILPPPNINTDVWRMLSIADDDTDYYMTPSIMEGRWPRGITSGYQGAIQVGQARLLTRGTIDSLERGLSGELYKIAVYIRDILQESVTIHTIADGKPQQHSISPDDLKANPVFHVKFEGETPEETDRRHRIGLEMWVHGALSRQTITKEYFGKDWIQERNQRIIEKLMESPQVLSAMANALIKAYGMERYKEQLEEAVKAAAQASPPVAETAPERPVNPDNFPIQRTLDQLGAPKEVA